MVWQPYRIQEGHAAPQRMCPGPSGGPAYQPVDNAVVAMFTALMENMHIMADNVRSMAEAVCTQKQNVGSARPRVLCGTAGGPLNPPTQKMHGFSSEPSANGEVW